MEHDYFELSGPTASRDGHHRWIWRQRASAENDAAICSSCHWRISCNPGRGHGRNYHREFDSHWPSSGPGRNVYCQLEGLRSRTAELVAIICIVARGAARGLEVAIARAITGTDR